MEVRAHQADTSTQRNALPGVPFRSKNPRPLSEVLGLCPPTIKPLVYTVMDPSLRSEPSRKKNRVRKYNKKIKQNQKSAGVTYPESTEKLRTTAAAATIKNHLPGEASASSSIFSSSLINIVPPTPAQDIIPTPLVRNAVLGGHPHSVDPPASPGHKEPPPQANEISSCSEVDETPTMSQPRKKARKRRRTTSRLSLSQSSLRQQQQSLDDQPQVPHSVVSSTRSSCVSNFNPVSQDSTASTDPSGYTARQCTPLGSDSLFTSSMLTGVDQPAKRFRQSVHTENQRQAQPSTTFTKDGVSSSRVRVCAGHQHTGVASCRRVTFAIQSPAHSLTHPEQPCSRRQGVCNVTSSSEDSDLSVYYEAHSHLSILDESCAGPSGVQSSPQCHAGQTLQPTVWKGDADTSSSSCLRESDHTSCSFSSSGSSTFISECLLNRTVLVNKQQSGISNRRAVHGVPLEGDSVTNQRQTKRHQTQLSTHTEEWQTSLRGRTGQGRPAAIRRSRPAALSMGPPGRRAKRAEEEEAEVSSSTSEYLSEEELRTQHLQGVRETGVRAELRMSSSTVSSSCHGSSTSSKSSSSSSSALLTQTGKDCIQAVGEVFKQYFGGTVEDNLSLLQRNGFNLVQCLMTLQATQPQPTPHHQPSPPPDTP